MASWDDFRDARLSRELLPGVRRRLDRAAAKLGHRLRLMEVCGTHTVAISRTGIREVLKEYVELVSGPGCPVCVTDQADIDRMVALARVPDVILTTFGDMMKVPGSRTTLAREKAAGRDVRVVYSPLDALDVARENPGRPVIFLGVGFETTAPAIALALGRARTAGLRNFTVLSVHKTTPPAVAAFLAGGEARIDGFILPGHVSVITGRAAWEFIGRDYGLPAYVTGFEPADVLASIGGLADALAEGRHEVVNNYPRAVREEGNRTAQEALRQHFTPVDSLWRGLGSLPGSGLGIRPELAAYDAWEVHPVDPGPTRVPKGCRCGEILKGQATPFDCPLFDRACTPERAVGPCMVSSEGACAAYYRYERKEAVL